MIICKNKINGEIVKFKNIQEILEEINRDRSENWSNYTKHDYKEGLKEFTEYEII